MKMLLSDCPLFFFMESGNLTPYVGYWEVLDIILIAYLEGYLKFKCKIEKRYTFLPKLQLLSAIIRWTRQVQMASKFKTFQLSIILQLHKQCY